MVSRGRAARSCPDQASSCGASATASVCSARQASSRSASAAIAERQDGGGEQRGIDGAGLADRQRADRHARRHLHDRQQAVLAGQRLRLDRHAEAPAAASSRPSCRAGARRRRRRR